MMLKPLIVSLTLALASASAWSQTAPTGTDNAADAAPGNPALRNAFADTLKPRFKRTAAKQNELYTPIKKQDDVGQIPEIEMFVGESRVFPTPGVARIAVGNGQIMTAAALDDKEVIVFANGVGTSSLFVWNADGRYQRVKVNIVPGDTSRIAREVAAFLSTIPHAKASIVGDKVIVEGDELSDADQAKVATLAKRYPQIVNFTSPIGWEKMVMMDVKVVEFPKTELRELGLKWSSVGGAAIGGVWGSIHRGNAGPYQIGIPSDGSGLPITNRPVPGVDVPPGTTIPSALNILGAMNLGLNATLNMLEQNGTASVLAEPQLSARSGSQASFLAGGEFPYSIATPTGVSLYYKPYGIKLDISPLVGSNGVIRAVIDSEVSSIDASVSTAAGPALLSRKTKTEFNVRNGETIVLSGLLQRNTNTDIDKVPMLGDIPILGALFRSKRFQNKETELVIFVTPTIVDSHSPGLVDRVKRATERLGRNLGKSPYLSDPLQPGRDAAKFNQAPPKPSASATITSGTMVDAATVSPVLQAAPIRSAQSVALVPASQNPLQATAFSAPSASKSGHGGSTLHVKLDGLVIRAEPNANSPALLELGYNSIVRLGDADPQPPGESLWRNVVAGDINGWVTASGVEPSRLQPKLRTFSHSAVARKDQTGKMLMLGSHGKGTPESSDASKTVTADASANHASSQIAMPKRYRVALQDLALHVSPDTNALIVQKLGEGQLVEALPQAPHGNWIAVQVDANRGWVASQWLQAVSPQN